MDRTSLHFNFAVLVAVYVDHILLYKELLSIVYITLCMLLFTS